MVTLRSGDPNVVVAESMARYGSIKPCSTGTSRDPLIVSVDPSVPIETRIPFDLLVSSRDTSRVIRFWLTIGELRGIDPIPDGPRSPARYWAYDDGDAAYSEHPVFNWIELRGRGTRLDFGDDSTAQISLPPGFTWNYYGQAYNQVSICGNGWVAPGYTTEATWINTELPSAAAPMMVALNWDDLNPPNGNGIWYMYDEVNHCFIVEYDSIAYLSAETYFDKFEILIYDSTVATPTGDNMIVVQYLTANNYTSNTVGLQDPTAAIGIQCLLEGAYHRGALPLTAGSAIKYLPGEPITAIREQPGTGRSRGAGIRVCVDRNPFPTSVNLAVELRRAGPLAAGIFDNAGRLVRVLTRNPNAGKTVNLSWDGRDASGQAVASGVYFYRVSAAGDEAQGKLVLTR